MKARRRYAIDDGRSRARCTSPYAARILLRTEVLTGCRDSAKALPMDATRGADELRAGHIL